MINNFKFRWLGRLLFAVVLSLPVGLFAQDKQTKDEVKATPTMKLNFAEVESVKTCNVTLVAGEKPLEGVSVKFYAKRFFSLLPLIANGKSVSTDEKGMAKINFPKELPGDCNGTIVVIAKVEDDEKAGNLEATDSVKWGNIISIEEQEAEWHHRSMAATGNRVPIFLLVAAGAIIIIVWGTLTYVMFSLVKIK